MTTETPTITAKIVPATKIEGGPYYRIYRDGAWTPWSISRGGFVGTSDDRIDSWYIDYDGEPLDRRGSGYATIAEAVAEIEHRMA